MMNTDTKIIIPNAKQSDLLFNMLLIIVLLTAMTGDATRAQSISVKNEYAQRANEQKTQSPEVVADNFNYSIPFAKILLKNRPFEIAQPALYEPVYTGVFPPSPNNPPITEAQGTQLLIDYANQDPFATPQGVLAVYNNPAMRAKVSHPSLGVAIASLQGTPGDDAAIDFYVNQRNSLGFPKVAAIFYADAPLPNNLNILVLYNASTQQVAYAIDPQLIRENPLLFRALFIHEALHQDGTVGLHEEATAYTFQALNSQLLLQYHPNLAALNSRLTLINRIFAAALSNSRPLDDNQTMMGMLTTNSQPTFPNTPTTATNFYQFVAVGANVPSPGNAELGIYQREFLGSNNCPTQEFDAAQFQCLDQAVAAVSMRKTSLFSPANRLHQALALRLNIFTGISGNLAENQFDNDAPPAELPAKQKQLLLEQLNNPAAPFASETSLQDLLKNSDWQIVEGCRLVSH